MMMRRRTSCLLRRTRKTKMTSMGVRTVQLVAVVRRDGEERVFSLGMLTGKSSWWRMMRRCDTSMRRKERGKELRRSGGRLMITRKLELSSETQDQMDQMDMLVQHTTPMAERCRRDKLPRRNGPMPLTSKARQRCSSTTTSPPPTTMSCHQIAVS